MFKRIKKLFLITVILLLVIQSFIASVYAAEKVNFPERAVTIICPWAAGGGTDALARFVADQLQKRFSQPFIVINKTGGDGAVGHTAGALAKPDGYTMTFATIEISNMHWMGLTDVSVDNFEYVIHLNQDPASVCVQVDSPWNTVGDLIDDIKNNPGKYMFSASATGGIWDLSRIGLLHNAGLPIDSVVWVPTTGAAPSITELLGGHIDVYTGSLPEAQAQIEAKLIKPIAIMADERDPNYPDVPTLKEQGINWSSGTWRGFLVPRSTPKEIVNILYEACYDVAQTDEFKDFMKKRGFGIRIMNSEEFENFAREQDQTWKTILELGGYTKES